MQQTYAPTQCSDEMGPLRYLWVLSLDRLLLQLTIGLSRHTRRLYRADLEHFRRWLRAPDLASALATFFGHGHDYARSLLLLHRDYLLETGRSVATVNRHLCSIRRAARVAREMGEIDWDLSDVSDIPTRDKGADANTVAARDEGGESAPRRRRCQWGR